MGRVGRVGRVDTALRHSPATLTAKTEICPKYTNKERNVGLARYCRNFIIFCSKLLASCFKIVLRK